MFTARQNILGHMQQGGRMRRTKKWVIPVTHICFTIIAGSPSPFDRNFGTKMGVKVYNWLIEQLSLKRTITAADIDTACILGLRSRAYQFQSVEKLKEETDFQYRRWKRQWWMHIRSIMKILAMVSTCNDCLLQIMSTSVDCFAMWSYIHIFCLFRSYKT